MVRAKCRVMLKAVFSTLRFIILILAGHKQIALENAALRQQLAILKREQPRPKLRHRDREKMANGACHCATRDRCELATAPIQAVLVEAFPQKRTWAAGRFCRSP